MIKYWQFLMVSSDTSSLYLVCNKDLINISRIALHVPGTEALISSLNYLLFVHFAVFIYS